MYHCYHIKNNKKKKLLACAYCLKIAQELTQSDKIILCALFVDIWFKWCLNTQSHCTKNTQRIMDMRVCFVGKYEILIFFSAHMGQYFKIKRNVCWV